MAAAGMVSSIAAAGGSNESGAAGAVEGGPAGVADTSHGVVEAAITAGVAEFDGVAIEPPAGA